jgi:two-component system sensor histidine kinase UhpB
MANVHVASRSLSRFAAFRRPSLRAAARLAEPLSTSAESKAVLSLRARLLGWVALGMFISLALGGAIACFNASRLAQTEMRSALAVSERTVRHALDGLAQSSDLRRELERLIVSFNGDRNVQATLVDATGPAPALVATSTLSEPSDKVPDWFLQLLRLGPETTRIPVQVGDFRGFVGLATDPSGEACEIWDGFAEALLVVGLFCGLTFPLVGWFTGRAVVGPLNSVSTALRRIGEGDYGASVPAVGPPELRRLAASFNRSADLLAGAETRNRRLHEQLLTLQEDERAAFARDLHDEIGPFLFAVNVDATAIARLADEQRMAEIPPHVTLIHEAVYHMQGQVKATLGRLRPVGLSEFGLRQAVERLVDFWRHRHPGTAFEVDVAIDRSCSGFGELVDATLYRVVQEGLSNAVRHSQASRIAISIAPDDAAGDIVASVIDDGRGMATTSGGALGFGLLGMRERVKALGGSLTVTAPSSNGDGPCGVAVVARLPRPNPNRINGQRAVSRPP